MKWLLLSFVGLAAIIGVVLIFFLLQHVYRYHTLTLNLPNGFSLRRDFPDGSTINLRNEDGDTVVTSVSSVMWCNDVVYGYRSGKLFIYDGQTQELRQYKTSVSYDTSAKDRRSIYFSQNEKSFTDMLKKLNVPAFDDKKAIRFQDVFAGLDNMPKKDEICRTSLSRF